MSSNIELPAHDRQTEKMSNEKPTPTYDDQPHGASIHITDSPNSQCKYEGNSTTPHIDSYLQQPSTKAAIRTLINALENLSDDSQCTPCTAQNATLAMTELMRDMRSAKKSGEWSKQDQKAVKQEFKGMFKGIKGDMKEVWKGKQAGVAAA